MNTSFPAGRWVSRILPWVGSAVVLIGAWCIVADTPTSAQKRPTFDVRVGPDTWGVGRNITARVVEITRSDRLESGDWSAPGNWLVVQVEAATVVDTGTLNLAQFSIDGVTYSATDRTESMRSQPLFVGVPLAGSLAFELPADLRSSVGELRLGLDSDTELDSVVVVAVDLSELPRVPTTSMQTMTFGAP